MKFKNFWLGIKDQLPLKRLIRNLWIVKITGMWHPRTHLRNDGKKKVMYNTKASAMKAAAQMEKKTGAAFSNWKCFHCDGYHIGKNSTETPNRK